MDSHGAGVGSYLAAYNSYWTIANHTTYVYIERPEDMIDPFHSNENFLTIVLTHAITFIVGVIGNSVVIATWARGGKLRSPTATFLVSLACADLLLLIIFMPLETLEYFVITWDNHGYICKLSSFVELLSGMSSILNLVAVSVERFLVIVYPIRARRWCTVTKSRRSLLLVWLLAVMFATPSILNKSTYSMTYYNNRTAITAYYCFEKSDQWAFYFAVYELMLLFIIPATLMVFCYSRVIKELWTSTRVITILTSASNPLPNSHTAGTRSYLVRWSANKHTNMVSISVSVSEPTSTSGSSSNSSTSANKMDTSTGSANCRSQCEPSFISRIILKTLSFAQTSKECSSVGQTEHHKHHRCHTKGLNSALPNSTSSTSKQGAAVAPQQQDTSTVTDVRRHLYCQVIKMLLFIVILFHVCWGPRLIFNLIRCTGLGIQQYDKYAYSARVYFYLLSFIHSALNPFVYGFMSSNFRRMMINSCNSHHHNHRVHGRTAGTPNYSLAEAMATTSCLGGRPEPNVEPCQHTENEHASHQLDTAKGKCLFTRNSLDEEKHCNKISSAHNDNDQAKQSTIKGNVGINSPQLKRTLSIQLAGKVSQSLASTHKINSCHSF